MNKINNNRNALVVTLGSEPQVVTLTLYGLKEQRPPVNVNNIFVIHTSPQEKQIKKAIETLISAFKEETLDRYTLTLVPIMDGDRKIADLESARAISALFKTVFKLFKKLKADRETIHLNASGGRKPMAIYSMVAAQMLFDEDDRAWYLISSKSLIESKKLFPEKRSHWIKLIRIPVLPWSEVDPVLTAAATHDNLLSEPDFWRALYRNKKHRSLVGFLYAKLSKGERVILFEVIKRGGTSKEIAKKLGKSRKTVEHQLRSIYSKAKLWFDLPFDVKLNREFLIREFRDFI